MQVPENKPSSDPQFLVVVQRAFDRLRTELQSSGDFLFGRAWQWMIKLSGKDRPEDYFLRPRSAPIVILAWWLEQALGKVPDPDLQSDLVYATVNKYYFIRLLDNVVDGHGVDPPLLHALGVWHAQFQGAYFRRFPSDHAFWEYFYRIWNRSAEVTARDSALTNIDLAAFVQYAAAKSCAATLPMAAVCYHYDRLDVLPAWLRFWEAFGRWNQMRDDLFDWQKDRNNGTPSYLLCEAERRRAGDEGTVDWLVREGFAWAVRLLDEWATEMKEAARRLNNPAVDEYVGFRKADLDAQIRRLMPALENLAALSRLEL